MSTRPAGLPHPWGKAAPLTSLLPPARAERELSCGVVAGGAKKRRGAAADTVFLNSRGEVTAYSADGARRWQVNAQTTWQRGGYDGHTAVAPTLLTFAPRVGGHASAVLAAGATLAHVISPQGT